MELGAWPGAEEGGREGCCWFPPAGLDNDVGREDNDPPGVGGAWRRGEGVDGWRPVNDGSS